MDKPVFIAGPCVIESAELLDTVAQELVRINQKYGIDIIFKASFDKANRTSLKSFRGPGLEKGLEMLADIKLRYGLRILTDIHEAWQADPVGKVADVIQIPAFLCRQTDLLVAAARTGKVVNIKKAQFLSGRDMRYPLQKCVESGATEVWLTERGSCFGYNNLVVDFRNIPDMLELCPTVVMDCTHSVQRPSAGDGKITGDRRFVPAMAMAATAAIRTATAMATAVTVATVTDNRKKRPGRTESAPVGGYDERNQATLSRAESAARGLPCAGGSDPDQSVGVFGALYPL